jgi:hypothetical protein
MMPKGPRILTLVLFVAFLFSASAAQAGTLNGTVINRTTGKPTANIDLTFLSPTQGMREVASAKSDPSGRFTVSNDQIGMGPILIRATFHDVNFNTFTPPGRQEVQVEIYDISKDIKTISIASHIVIFQPQGDKLLGAEEYEIENASQPAMAYFRSEGNFDFSIPENGTLGQISTTNGSTGMPVNQASIDKQKGHYAIAYAFRPGQTNVRLSYQVPYANGTATVKLPATYPDVKMLVVVPPGVTVKGDGLVAAGKEQGMIVFTHDPLPAKAVLSVSLAGQGSLTDAGAQDQGQAPSAAPAQEGNSRTGPEVIAAPSRLDDLKWILLAGLAALFAMSGILLARKQVVVAGSPAVEEVPTPQAAKSKAVSGANAAPAPKPAAGNSHESNGDVASYVNASMDSLKDQIFRLELRRQAGTISDEDYAREKAQVEKVLRDLVKG